MDTTVKYRQKKVLLLLNAVNEIAVQHSLHYQLGYGSLLGAVRHNGFIPWDYDVDIMVSIKEYKNFRDKMKENLPSNMCIKSWETEKKYHPAFDRIVFHDENHSYVHVDIFPMIGTPKKNKNRKIFSSISYYSYKLLQCKYKDTKYSKKYNIKKIEILKIILIILPNFLRKWYINTIYTMFDYDNSNYLYNFNSSYKHKDIIPKKFFESTIYVQFETLILPITKYFDEYLTSLYGDYMIPIKEYIK